MQVFVCKGAHLHILFAYWRVFLTESIGLVSWRPSTVGFTHGYSDSAPCRAWRLVNRLMAKDIVQRCCTVEVWLVSITFPKNMFNPVSGCKP
jgi:hypothetical protein